MKKNSKKGFTLIELLVVVAIIGVLASVVLASLNTARAKGANAAIKANMANIRAQAEIVYDSTSPNGYGTASNASVCPTLAAIGGGTANSVFSSSPATTLVIANQVASAIQSSTGTSGTQGTDMFCGSTTIAWAASVKLKVAEGSNNFWCVDSTGASKGEAAVTATTVCA